MKKIKSRKKRIKRLRFISGILGIGILAIIIIRIGSVRAGTSDSNLLKNRKEGIYAVTNLNGNRHLYYLNMYTMNGVPSYCIELGVDITNDIYNSNTNFSGSNLSDRQINYIKEVSYFGYKYKGHDDYRYYMASQELIWEYLSGATVEWTNVEDFNGARINIDSYKNDIINLINNYKKDINIVYEDGNKLIYGKSYVSVDKNNVLSNYEVYSKNGLDISIDGNKLYYEVNNKNIDKVSFRLKYKNYYSYNSKFYYFENSQKLISSGNFINRVYDASFDVIKNNLDIQVVDMDTSKNTPQGEASLGGAMYEIYKDDVKIKEFSTDKDGHALVEDLESGEYIIKQIKASQGYLVNGDEVKVTIKDGNNSVILKERVISNNIVIYKYYGDNVVESNIKFSIFDKNINLYKEVITNNDGYVSFILPYGTYTIKQDNSTLGYYKVDDFKIIVNKVIDKDVRYDLNDKRILYNVKINTRDINSLEKILLDGFKYKIFDKDSNKYLECDGIDTFSTDKKGEVNISSCIGYGNYALEEVDVPYGYVLNKNIYEFSVNNDSDNKLIEIDFYNKVIMGRLNVHVDKEKFATYDNGYKYDKESYKGKEVRVYAKEDIIFHSKKLYNALEQVDSGITDDNGNVVIDNLYLGKYCATIDDNLDNCIDINTDKNDIDIVDGKINLISSLYKGEVILNNIDSNNNGIDGSVIELYKEDNLINTSSTNEDGIIKIKDLVNGNYCFRQKSVPYGYVFNGDKICFEINNNKVSVNLINDIETKKSIIVPNTFSDVKANIKLIIMILLMVMGVVIYKKKSIFN